MSYMQSDLCYVLCILHSCEYSSLNDMTPLTKWTCKIRRSKVINIGRPGATLNVRPRQCRSRNIDKGSRVKWERKEISERRVWERWKQPIVEVRRKTFWHLVVWTTESTAYELRGHQSSETTWGNQTTHGLLGTGPEVGLRKILCASPQELCRYLPR